MPHLEPRSYLIVLLNLKKNKYVLTYLFCHNIPPVDFLMCRFYLVVGLFCMLRIYIKITTKENTHDVAIWGDLRSPLPQMGFILDDRCRWSQFSAGHSAGGHKRSSHSYEKSGLQPHAGGRRHIPRPRNRIPYRTQLCLRCLCPNSKKHARASPVKQSGVFFLYLPFVRRHEKIGRYLPIGL